jgi:hypothetical protein
MSLVAAVSAGLSDGEMLRVYIERFLVRMQPAWTCMKVPRGAGCGAVSLLVLRRLSLLTVEAVGGCFEGSLGHV